MCSIITRKMHKYSNGTDGCRIRCRQFSPSSLPRLENCIFRCTTCWREMNSFKVGTLLALSRRRPGPKHPNYGIPTDQWPTVVQRVVEQQEPLRTVAAE